MQSSELLELAFNLAVKQLQSHLQNFKPDDKDKVTELIIILLQLQIGTCPSLNKEKDILIGKIENAQLILKKLLILQAANEVATKYQEWKEQLYEVVEQRLLEKKISLSEFSQLEGIPLPVFEDFFNGVEEISPELVVVFKTSLSIPLDKMRPPADTVDDILLRNKDDFQDSLPNYLDLKQIFYR